jgi:hypothetical protein
MVLDACAAPDSRSLGKVQASPVARLLQNAAGLNASHTRLVQGEAHMALTQQSKTSVVTAQDEIPTVRPARASLGVSLSHFAGVRGSPLPPSLWQLAREVMRAEAEEALGARR